MTGSSTRAARAGRLGARLPVPVAAVNGFAMLAVIVVMGLPMLNVLAVSLSTQAGSENPGLVLFPSPATLEGYSFIWSYISLWRPFANTAYVAVVGTILHVILSAMGGYVLMQRGLPLRKIMTTFVILTMTIPGELTLVSIYQVNRDFGLVNRFAGLIINGAASGFSILLMRNYFMSIPQSLAEAARMDGSSELSTFLRIYLRLAVPATMTVGTLAFIHRWNNIALVVTLISDLKKTTLPVILRGMLVEVQSTSGTAYIYANAKMAAVVISALPLIVLYFSAQRFFVAGAMLGATKE
jgi:putative aldouronate transport system permease protein